MLAYHNEPKLKVKTVAAMKADIKAERLIKGSYWDAKKKNGCFVGCVIRDQHGGSNALMAELNGAMQQAREELA